MAMLNEASLSPADAHAHANATTPTHSKAAMAMASSATTMLTTKTPFSIEHILFQNLNSASNNNANSITGNSSNYAQKSSKNAMKSARSSYAHLDNNPQKHPSHHSHHPPQSHPPASASATATTRGNQAASGYGSEDYAKSLHNAQRSSHHSRPGASHYSGDQNSQQLGSGAGQNPPVPAPQPPPPPPLNGGTGGSNGVLYPNAPYTDHGFLQMTLGYLSPSSGTYKSVDPYFLSQ
uniref:LOW QUALITY PROTEIN: brain-specific homeobox protein-like n=1 Tax=Drosophila rhopaloa TaxID=1041015 RepID=A0A6P4EIL4_DRORH